MHAFRILTLRLYENVNFSHKTVKSSRLVYLELNEPESARKILLLIDERFVLVWYLSKKIRYTNFLRNHCSKSLISLQLNLRVFV